MGTARINDPVSHQEGDSAALHIANDVLDHLSLGREISPDAIGSAREAILDRVRMGQGALEPRHVAGLTTLFARAANDLDRGGLIGELIAVGPRAGPVIESALGEHSDLVGRILKPSEAGSLRHLLGLPIEERLAHVAGWLEGETKKSNPSRDAPSPKIPDDISGDAVLSRRREEEDRLESAETPPESSSAPPQDVLCDLSLPEEQRGEAALSMGTAALPLLRGLAQDKAQQEFVISTLVRLGRAQGSRQATLEAAGRMHLSPQRDVRAVGAQVMRSLEGETSPRTDKASSGQIEAPQEGWLGRALRQCSASNILAAAAGREAMAIPLVILKLSELRGLRSSGLTRP